MYVYIYIYIYIYVRPDPHEWLASRGGGVGSFTLYQLPDS